MRQLISMALLATWVAFAVAAAPALAGDRYSFLGLIASDKREPDGRKGSDTGNMVDFGFIAGADQVFLVLDTTLLKNAGKSTFGKAVPYGTRACRTESGQMLTVNYRRFEICMSVRKSGSGYLVDFSSDTDYRVQLKGKSSDAAEVVRVQVAFSRAGKGKCKASLKSFSMKYERPRAGKTPVTWSASKGKFSQSPNCFVSAGDGFN